MPKEVPSDILKLPGHSISNQKILRTFSPISIKMSHSNVWIYLDIFGYILKMVHRPVTRVFFNTLKSEAIFEH